MFFSEASSASGFFYLVPFVVFFPVIGLLINIILGGKLGEKAIGQAEIFAREGSHIARLNINPGSEIQPGTVEISG